MNDPPPRLYMAVMLWQEFIPIHRTEVRDKTEEIRLAPAQLAEEMRGRSMGGIPPGAVRQGLELLEVAGLARRRQEVFSVWHKTIARGRRGDVRGEIASRAEKRGRPELATSEEGSAARERRQQDKITARTHAEGQLPLDNGEER